jgi:hypothetical protein
MRLFEAGVLLSLLLWEQEKKGRGEATLLDSRRI